MTNNNCTNLGQLHFVIKLYKNLCLAGKICWLITLFSKFAPILVQIWENFEKMNMQNIPNNDKLCIGRGKYGLTTIIGHPWSGQDEN